jgi:hypothetical protein
MPTTECQQRTVYDAIEIALPSMRSVMCGKLVLGAAQITCAAVRQPGPRTRSRRQERRAVRSVPAAAAAHRTSRFCCMRLHI